MAERPGVEQVLSRLNDLKDSLVSNKRFDDLADLVQRLADSNKKLVAEIEALRADVVKSTKAQADRSTELEDFLRKEIKKLRDEVLEQVEEASAGGGDPESAETNKLVKETIGEVKGMLGHLFGDEEVMKAARGRIKKWILKEGAKTIAGSAAADDE